MSRKERYGCLYLNPSRELVQCAEISGMKRPARSVPCAYWPARDHHSNVSSVARTAMMALAAFPAIGGQPSQRKQRCNVLFTTFMGITGIENKQKRRMQNFFFIFRGEWHILTVGISGPIHDVTVRSNLFLFFVSLLGPVTHWHYNY
jgi:hypothetical protein